MDRKLMILGIAFLSFNNVWGNSEEGKMLTSRKDVLAQQKLDTIYLPDSPRAVSKASSADNSPTSMKKIDVDTRSTKSDGEIGMIKKDWSFKERPPVQWKTPSFKVNKDATFFKVWESPMAVQMLLNNLKRSDCSTFISDSIVDETEKRLCGEENLLVSVLYFAQASFAQLSLNGEKGEKFNCIKKRIQEKLKQLAPCESAEQKTEICKMMFEVAVTRGYHESFLKIAINLVKDSEDTLECLKASYNEKFQRAFGISVSDLLD